MSGTALRREVVRDAAVGVGIADGADGLAAIHRPGCAAAIWRRQPEAGVQAMLDALDPARLPGMRLVLRPDAVGDAVGAACCAAGMPQALVDWLVADVAMLSAAFARVMPAPWQRVRLSAVTTDSCRRFHVDAVTARLVCTYRGPGTQYGISTDGGEPARVFPVPTGAPVVIRGTLWQGDRPSGLLHRSPPIAGTGISRLVLVLDPVDETDEDD